MGQTGSKNASKKKVIYQALLQDDVGKIQEFQLTQVSLAKRIRQLYPFFEDAELEEFLLDNVQLNACAYESNFEEILREQFAEYLAAKVERCALLVAEIGRGIAGVEASEGAQQRAQREEPRRAPELPREYYFLEQVDAIRDALSFSSRSAGDQGFVDACAHLNLMLSALSAIVLAPDDPLARIVVLEKSVYREWRRLHEAFRHLGFVEIESEDAGRFVQLVFSAESVEHLRNIELFLRRLIAEHYTERAQTLNVYENGLQVPPSAQQQGASEGQNAGQSTGSNAKRKTEIEDRVFFMNQARLARGE